MQVNNVFEKNMQAIEETDLELYQKIQAYMLEHTERDKTIQVGYLENDAVVLTVTRDEHLWYMNSCYDEEKFCKIWCEQFEKTSYLTPYIIYGLGTGSFIRKLNEGLAESNIVLVVEPEPEIFMEVLFHVDITDIIYSNNVILAVNEMNVDSIIGFMEHIMSYGRIQITEYGILPNYLRLYPEGWKDLKELIKDACEREVMNRNTSVLFASEFAGNYLANMMDMPKQYTINQLKGICTKLNITDVPAVIVSAGPSLDKNIEDLKAAEGKAFIIATDSALRPLLAKEILPDVAVTIDPHKPFRVFSHSGVINIPIVACGISNKKLWPFHKGKRFYFSEGNRYIDSIYKRYGGIILQSLNTGGSVANNCFSLAEYLGFKKIILIGQDLGYPEKKQHAYAVYDSHDFAKDGRSRTEVEDIYGNMILTDFNMKSYLRWFENQIILYPELQVMDATEGGAKIAGTEILTLKEAIRRECIRDIDFKGEIEALQPAFSQREQEEIYDTYEEIPVMLDELTGKLKNGIKQYEKLKKVYHTKGIESNEYHKLTKKTGKLAKEMDKEPLFSLIETYNQFTQYQILDEVYVVQENMEDEIDSIADSGIRMLQSYVKAIDMFRKDYEHLHDIDMEKVRATLKDDVEFSIQIVAHIKKRELKEAQVKIRRLVLTGLRQLDWIHEIQLGNVWNVDGMEEQLHTYEMQLLHAQEEENFESIRQCLEKQYIPFVEELIMIVQKNPHGEKDDGEVQ